MDGGTPCPLKAGQNRKTRVQYICNAQAFHNEILRYCLFPSYYVEKMTSTFNQMTIHFGPGPPTLAQKNVPHRPS